jgi:hypothetical protein
MNRNRRRLIPKILFLLTGTLSLCCVYDNLFGSENVSDFTHTIAWGPWDGGFGQMEKVKVDLDGKMIGERRQALHVLRYLKVEQGDIIKFELPAGIDLLKNDVPLYSNGTFLGVWIKKGVKIIIYKDNKRYNLYTLTWDKYQDDVMPTMDKAHYILNGKDIGSIKDGTNALEKIQWDKDDILWVLVPYALPPEPLEFYPDDLSGSLRRWSKKYGLISQIIIPNEG